MPRLLGRLPALAWLLLAAGAIEPTPAETSAARPVISGVVRDHSGPLAGAVVRVPGRGQAAVTDAEGRFTLATTPSARSVDVSAWAPGYFIGGRRQVAARATNVLITLAAQPTRDNPDYPWVSAFAQKDEPLNCQRCMASGQERGKLPFDEWQRDAHRLAPQNPRFLSMYFGTDLGGRRSPPTRYVEHRDYGRIPLRPDAAQPYHGPGFKLDFPASAGNCATCHAPAGAARAPYASDLARLHGVEQEGVTCDLCHKVWEVRLDPARGLPFPNMPGVLSYEFLRPPSGQQVFVGPYDDVAGHSLYSPLQNRSEFCAPCHFGVFWNVVIYNSFGEWLASPYADADRGKTCQDCHMPRLGATRIAQPVADSARVAYDRDPQTVFSHLMPGAGDTNLLRNAVTLTTAADLQGDRVRVRVAITNDKTGHHVPSDSPLRHLILLVNALDDRGQALVQLEGPTVPAWAGRGAPEQGNYAGQPGTAFAKVLEELWTEVSPTGAYWNPTRLLSDNRIPAFGIDTSAYVFAAPCQGAVTVEVRLLYRRAFKTLMDQKGWKVPDVTMAQERTVLQP